jgi:arabinan endo-1,5-alpha-L-arabinosidase
VNISDAEGSSMVYHSGYYYVFYNRGSCCSGTSSTYYVSVARSTSPTSGFSGNRVIIGSSSPCIGPGHLGYFNDGGTEYASYHYIDANSNGYPRLAVSKFGWNSDGWPYMSPDWIPNGTYKITAQSDGLAWDDWGCTGASGQAVAQGTYSGLTCQKWTFTQVGWGMYKITCATGGLSVEAVNCANTNGTKLDLYSDWAGSCQRWKIYRASNGGYVFATMNGSGNGTTVIEVPSASSTTGVQLGLYSYGGGSHQKWNIAAP